ncbi:hypothetical protein PIB30_006355 [Stylosanthes scabra]|uniref:Ubiquitin-like protease family profile domain-containing protein n=1 Tax=Stylosanthes scabra TaxID=79078 RepID=A0ABU6S400_9FABA|nr:hypothetical protein [Stylosanthes scabra]
MGCAFVGTELAVATYIFANAGEDRERLYDDSHCDGTRLRFWSLIPGRELNEDVLNMVAGMCTTRKFDNSKWWLPTTFSQMIVKPELYNQDTMDYIKDRYMGYADDLKTVRFPQTCCLEFNHPGKFVEAMLKDNSFWAAEEHFPPFVSDYKPLVPEVGRQADGSMDCGVWVCQCMVNSHLWLDYNLQDINDSTRISLAIDLVTSPQNPLANLIWERAVNFWDAEMLRDFNTTLGERGHEMTPARSGSQTI